MEPHSKPVIITKESLCSVVNMLIAVGNIEKDADNYNTMGCQNESGEICFFLRALIRKGHDSRFLDEFLFNQEISQVLVFTIIKDIKHNIYQYNHFKVYNLASRNTFLLLCMVAKHPTIHFHQVSIVSCALLLTTTLRLPLPSALANYFPFVSAQSRILITLGVSSKWNQLISVNIEISQLKFHSCCCVYQIFFIFKQSDVFAVCIHVY